MYLRAAKEAHEFTVNVLSEKFRRASRLMNHANAIEPFVDDPADYDPRRPQATGSLFLRYGITSDGRLDLLRI